ncbi:MULTISPECIES: flagellar biosynthetic protein FliO [unclassified Vibrio]|uniref:Flagellar protein n=1 Tax=Vibrio sp. HB236076 TaxID=3232307 RepID=A0AB39HIJ7_9VIBR|nr:flagellar biosynthetic protein FliO [Vibrio sp. HB161653]MDP5254791.1 flagellar biosynthetic protein FliO [Vibrio sp. HB161653]
MSMYRLAGLVVSLCFISRPLMAAEQGQGPSLEIASSVLSLLLVIALIVILAWGIKRLNGGGLTQRHGLKIISQLPVGTKERIAVVEAGDEQFLIGVTAQNIHLIAKLEQRLESTAGPAASPFQQLLAKRIKTDEK